MASLVAALKLVDIIILVVKRPQILDQLKLLDAIVQVGTIKQFIPSEFGNYPGDSLPVLHEVILDNKARVKKAVEKSGIPYTYVISDAGASWFLPSLWQDGLQTPPRNKIIVYDNGNVKAVIIDNDDLGTYTILGADDPRTMNKYLYFRPEGVYNSQNELVAIWEKKIEHPLEKTYIPKEKLRKMITESPDFANLMLAIKYSYLVQGYKSDLGTDGVEAFALYPDVKYTSANEYLDCFL